jgi:hypothetical protein
MAFLCVFKQGEFKNTIKKKLFVGSPCQKLLAEKVEICFSCRLFPSAFLIAFLAVSQHEEPKNTTKMFSKIRLENLKKSQKKVGR